MFDASRWTLSVREALRAPIGDVVFDMDGTLLAGDLGELVMFTLLERGHRPPALRALLGAHIEEGYRRAQQEGRDADHYAACSLVAEGLTPDAVSALAGELFDAGAIGIRLEVLELLRVLDEVGHRVWIVTGTLDAVAWAAADRLGVDRSRTLGVRLARSGGRFLGRLDGPLHLGEGKVRTLETALDACPLLVLGDTAGDLAMMARASIGAVAVPQRDGEFARAAAEAGFDVRLPEDLQGG